MDATAPEPPQGGSPPGPAARRPLASRDTLWARWLAARLVRKGVTPNAISAASIPVALSGAALIVWGAGPLASLLAALAVQLRLLCNLLDGMVAIEGGKASAVGPLWNEIPDRVADALLLVAAGHAVGRPWLGWAAALLAALTAYIRVLGGALGLRQSFAGIMAKQRRMAALTVALALQAIELAWWGSRLTLEAALWLITLGSIVTCWTRTTAIARGLQPP